MRDLVYELKQLAERHREGSFATQADRKTMLLHMGEQLVVLGYKDLHAVDLKGRHVNKLLARWTTNGLAPSTIKNRMSVLRWWARHVDNPGALKTDNAAYGIPQRETVARVSKAKELPVDALVKVRDRHVRMSLVLQRVFGLRREEAIKLKPWQADRGDRLVLQASWTKGGRAREVPIRTLDQREALDKAKDLAQGKTASLIPADKTYIEQLHRYESQTTRAGLHKLHGLRHAYAQDRFLELTGFACPAAGGPGREQLTPVQREADYDARVLISDELGHCREAITAAYLGR
jgi:site-specific recombinase XerC